MVCHQSYPTNYWLSCYTQQIFYGFIYKKRISHNHFILSSLVNKIWFNLILILFIFSNNVFLLALCISLYKCWLELKQESKFEVYLPAYSFNKLIICELLITKRKLKLLPFRWIFTSIFRYFRFRLFV